ncbi:N-acetylmuramoyl-L-alanine amidase [Lysinibacillus sp. SGAir0095]|uniref:N-acetylmuramoyl-L-alanine amidase n=1 Tax=Lysinibacillus sp. SGAir0095 TaxID=2070463 RepID=UPI0010CCD560|nr:N-acetylmuramoyl-L-alanine amidase [Lysinibacillus sp. SGAir0095]QCR32701.1 N-acetylmuramoyl-L-alanine amidase [Lysinibacillus sp. SGAir0095]
MIKVGYDAGHGYHTAGKRTPDGEREWSFNDKVARAFANELALYKGVMTRRYDDPTGQRDVPLRERTDGANNWAANYYISFHHNALGGRWGNHTGVETFVNTNPQPRSVELANAIHPAIVKAYGLSDRGIKRGNLHIVRETAMPAILIEGGFMDSLIDVSKLRNDTVLSNVGKAVAQSFAEFAGLSRVTSPEEELTMAQYEELKRLINAQANRINVLESLAGVKEREVLADHREAWEWATSQGLVNGAFPNRPLTREQFASIEYRKATQGNN